MLPMAISYFPADDVKEMIKATVAVLNMRHINPEQVACIRSRGSSSRRTIARIHGTPRIWQAVMRIQPLYIIEVIGERFDRLSLEDQEKVIIHELLHIPKGFRGGLRCHGSWTSRGRIDALYGVMCKSRNHVSTQLLDPENGQL